VAALLPPATAADAGAMAGFQMIVHPSNPATTVDRRFVGDAFLRYQVRIMVGTLLFTLVADGLVNPAVEELYFRAYLLPRLPVRGVLAVVTSAGLFALQHYWQPEKLLFVFVAQLVLIAVMLRVRSVRISIAAHCLANSLAILLALVVVLR